MGQATVMNNTVLVGAGANQDIQPPITQDWEVTAIGSSVWVGVVPFQLPQVDVSLFDGTIQAEIIQSTDVRGWQRPLKIQINNGNYLRLNNPGGAGANISWSAKLVRYFGAGTSNVVSDLATVGAAATWDVRPGVGYDWKISDFASNTWVGAAPAAVPNIDVNLTDGTLVAQILDPVSGRLWETQLELFAGRTVYLRMTNTAGAPAVLGFTGEIYRYFGAGASVVESILGNAGIAGSVDFQPADGEEWRVTCVAGATWVGVPPLLFPDLTVHFFNGTIASQISSQTDWLMNGHVPEIVIENANYLRVTNTNAAAQNVGVSAELIQRYA